MRSLIYDIYEAAGALRTTGQALARAESIKLAQWTLMETIHRTPMTVARAARRLGVSRQSVQKTANELVDLNHLRLVENPDHKTSPLIELTETGEQVLARLNTRATESNHRLFGTLTDHHIQTTRTTLRAMTQAIYDHG